jgi:hypothetical protein
MRRIGRMLEQRQNCKNLQTAELQIDELQICKLEELHRKLANGELQNRFEHCPVWSGAPGLSSRVPQEQ